MRALAVLLILLAAPPLSAQTRPRPERERRAEAMAQDSTRDIVLSAHPLLYTGFGAINDPASQSQWVFADAALGGGGALHVQASDAVWLGVEATYARTNYERRMQGTRMAVAAGRAGVATLGVSARLSSAGLGRLPGMGGRGMGGLGALLGLGGLGYISLGAGAIGWSLDDLDQQDVDAAVHLGGGLEYSRSGRAAFLEYRQLWSFHQREGVDDRLSRHGRLDFGVRAALRR